MAVFVCCNGVSSVAWSCAVAELEPIVLWVNEHMMATVLSQFQFNVCRIGNQNFWLISPLEAGLFCWQLWVSIDMLLKYSLSFIISVSASFPSFYKQRNFMLLQRPTVLKEVIFPDVRERQSVFLWRSHGWPIEGLTDFCSSCSGSLVLSSHQSGCNNQITQSCRANLIKTALYWLLSALSAYPPVSQH